MESTVGSILKESRESRGLTVESLARRAAVVEDYVRAFEEGRYGAFPARVYALGHLRRLIFHLGISDAIHVQEMFDREWNMRSMIKDTARAGRAGSRGRMRFVVTPAVITSVAAFGLIVFFAGLIGVQLDGFVGKPSLEIASPSEGMRIDRPYIIVEGRGERESQLTVNGREIIMDESGYFREYIELLQGLNTLTFYLQNRFGALTEDVRHVVVE